jgi:plasmid stabilization system protein ParE
MKYGVVITPDAENDLRTAYHYIRKYAPKAAHSNDVDQSIRFDADQIGAKRRKALSV